MTKTWKEAWAEAEAIEGWYVAHEGKLLYDLAAAVPEGRSIVEVGSWHGRSAAVLASVGRPVILVDPMSAYNGPTCASREDIDALARFVAAHDNVRWKRCRTGDLCAEMYRVGMVHVDGDHAWPHPLLDYLHLEPGLAPDAVAAFHDAHADKGPMLAVRALEAAGKLERLARAGGLLALRRTG